MLPDYLKETFDTKEPFTILMLAMAGICSVHVLVSAVRFVFRKRPVRGERKKKRNGGEAPEKTAAAEGLVAIDANSNAAP